MSVEDEKKTIILESWENPENDESEVDESVYDVLEVDDDTSKIVGKAVPRKEEDIPFRHLQKYQFGPGNKAHLRKKKTKTFKKAIEEVWNLALTPNALSDKNAKLKSFLQARIEMAKEGDSVITLRQAMVFAQMYKAINGDTTAFNALLDRVEGKPVQMNVNENSEVKYVDFINQIGGVVDDGEDEDG